MKKEKIREKILEINYYLVVALRDDNVDKINSLRDELNNTIEKYKKLLLEEVK